MLDQMKVGKSMRMFLAVVATISWLGIWLTGWNVAHWLIFLPAAFFTFAAISGICPGIFFSKLISGEK